MKKTPIILFGILVVGLITLYGISKLASQKQFGGGSAINVSYYKTATSTSVVCSGATSTLILAAAQRQDSRNVFELTVASSSVTLCKSSTGCVSGNGLNLGTATSTGRYFQVDAYYGAYSCIGNGNTSSTIGVIEQQL